MIVTMLAAAAQQSPRGWGGPIGLAVALTVFLSFVGLRDRAASGKLWPSPPPGEEDAVDDGTQVRHRAGTTGTTSGTTGGTDRGGLWGDLRQSLWATDSRRRDDVDDDLGDDEDEDVVDEDADPGPAAPETAKEAITRMVAAQCRYADIVRYLRRTYGMSERTAKRRIRDVRQATSG